MIRAAFRKAWADARGRRLQMLLLFVVIGAAAGTLMLAIAVRSSASEPFKRTIRETNAAHLWVTTNNPDVDLMQLAGLPGVKATSGPYPQLWAGYSISTPDKKQQFYLTGMDEELPPVDHPAVTNGRWVAPSTKNEIVLDRGAARRLGIAAGDRVDLLVDDRTVPFTVVGLAVPTGRAPVPIVEEGIAYVLRDTLEVVVPGGEVGRPDFYRLRLGIQLTGSDSADEFLAAADEILKTNGVELLDTRDEIASDIEESNTFDVIFLSVFSIFALLAAGLIIANAMAGQILSQRRDIGLLKALGFTPGQVTLVFLAESLALSLVASLAGVVAGLAVAPMFLSRSAELLGVPATPVIEPVSIAMTVAIVLVIVAAFTGLSAWNAGRVSTVQALSSKSKSRAHHSLLGSLAARARLPIVVVLGVKDLSSHPGRTIATTVALVLAVVTATFTLGFEATFDTTMSDPARIGGAPADLTVDRDRYAPDEAIRILDSRPEIERYIVRTDVDASFRREEVELRGLEGNLEKGDWVFLEGRMVSAPGEVAVGENMAGEFGIAVGDRVALDIPETRKTLDLVVVGRFVELDENVMMVTNDTLPPRFLPTDYYIWTVAGTDNSEFRRTLLQASGGNFDPEVSDESFAAARRQLRTVILPLNAVLFGIAAINLLSTLMLGIRESQRDYAVFKTLGLTPGQIAASVLSGSVVLAGAAVLLGVPLGLVATVVMFNGMSEALNVGTDIGTMPSLGALLLIVPGAVVIAALGSALPARVAAAIRATDALRYE